MISFTFNLIIEFDKLLKISHKRDKHFIQSILKLYIN